MSEEPKRWVGGQLRWSGDREMKKWGRDEKPISREKIPCHFISSRVAGFNDGLLFGEEQVSLVLSQLLPDIFVLTDVRVEILEELFRPVTQ